MPQEKSIHYIRGAMVLTAAAFIVKILSAAYRVPFQNIVGDIGFYIYQQVYPIYGIGAVLATSGFPIIISKMAAESEAGKRNKFTHDLQAAFLTLLILGLFFNSLFFFGANIIARLMGDELLAPLIKVTSFTFLFMPFLSVWRGYFQGVGNMVPTAITQVTEQLARVSAILLIASLLIANGHSLYEAGRGAWAGSLLGGFIGLLLITIFAARYKIIFPLIAKGLTLRKFYRTAHIVLVHGTAMCLSGMVLILFQFIDSFSLYSLLVHSGIETEQAKALKGIFDRGQPLIQLGTVAAASFSLALVPLIASAWMKGDTAVLQTKAINAVKISTVIGTGAAVGLANIMRPTNAMLFENSDGSSVLSILAIAIFFSSLIMVCSGILQGLGHVFAPAKYILIGLAFKATGNLIFVPLYGTKGAALATIIGLAMVTILLIKKLNKRVNIIEILSKMIKNLSLAGAAMTVILQLWMLLFTLANVQGRLWSTMIALSSVSIGGAVFLAVILRTRLLTEEEITILPFGSRLSLINANRKREKRQSE
ncbi:putative polysaccharide biosynthesis protein [Lederbergia citrea]|uniref:putative polysaccharide biosynthesis protein n=1 Tax=Lederbergia citrea TaxID=2833581 RepID=UPI001BCA1AD5|nr:polysaccharide biosynthesis protein [Lederbergia citrea]MBS4179726.1 polysaccharide biosynthesis protein [Lederbergia citrea]